MACSQNLQMVRLELTPDSVVMHRGMTRAKHMSRDSLYSMAACRVVSLLPAGTC